MNAQAIPAGIERWPVTDRAAWLARREKDVTASVIAALVGAHPYTTAYRLYAVKMGLVEDDEALPDIGESSVSLPPMLRGMALEPVTPCMLGYLRPDWQVEPCGFYYRDPVHRIGATPDFIAVDPSREGFGIVQAKTAGHFAFRDAWIGDDGKPAPPLWIACQAIVEAALTGAAWCAVTVMVTSHNLDLHLMDVPLHEGLMGRLRNEVAAFWGGIAERQPTAADYARDGATIAAVHFDDDGSEIDLSRDNRVVDLLEQRAGLKDQEAAGVAAERHRKVIDSEILHKLGDAQRGLLADGRVIEAKTVSRSACQVKASTYRQIKIKGAA